MTEEMLSEPSHPTSDLAAHNAPGEHHVIKHTLWQRWMAWNGSFLIISVLLHILLIGGATFVAVQVVQSRKEKLKFTAPPPNPNPGVEYKVKPSKKTAAAAPAVSKRITSTALNTSVALPALDLNSTGPDVMASVMSGMGASGLGAGASGGAAGMASMSFAGLTAFGFRGNGNVGLTGKFYDLKQTPSRKPLNMSVKEELGVLREFVGRGWDISLLDGHYFSASNSIKATQFYIPVMPSVKAPEAFAVEKEVQPSYWMIHYKGTVTASKTTRFRFRARGDNILAVRFDNKNVLLNTLQDLNQLYPLFPDNQPLEKDRSIMSYGAWIDVRANKSYPMEVILSDYGGTSSFFLCLEEEHPSTQYEIFGKSTNIIYPLFQLKKDIPLPEHVVNFSLFGTGSAVPVDKKQDVFDAK